MFSENFLERNGVLITWLASTFFIFLRYLLFAGTAFLISYKAGILCFLKRKIQKRLPSSKQLQNEIAHSITSIIIFGLFAVLTVLLRTNGYTLMYFDLADYGYAYLAVSFVASIFLHDTYFYWMHRLLHWQPWFKQIHATHHRSHNPTPWASFAFHPMEAILEFAILPILVYILPMHPIVLLAWSLWMISWNVLGHLGYEIFPKEFSNSVWFKWINTSTHHNLHHSNSRGNFGLYFNFWDRWMDTNDGKYRQTFENIVNKHS
jgi:sterol desaturase/sphingolipid hydroxylase (fatty acid hydroxylase superfamily)